LPNDHGAIIAAPFIVMTFRSIAAVVFTSLCLHHHAAADSAIEPLVGFEMGPNPNGATVPLRPALYLHPDGNFYGTTPGGGAFGFGTLFQMSKSGVFGHLSFSDINAGSLPAGRQPGSAPTSTPVLSSDGWLWGTTSAGGVNSTYGTIFRIRPENGEFQTMHNFASGFEGNSPVCGLVSDGQGYLWGVTRYTNNGTLTNGILYRIHELTGVFERKLTFGDTVAPNKGRVPQGALYYDGAGNLWGSTSAGSSNGHGNLFKYTIATSTFTIVTEFSDRGVAAGAIKGSGAASALVPDGNGFLWGVTPYGGDSTGNGTVFKVEMATGAATSVIEFSNNGTSNKGSTPVGPLVNDGVGNLWGVTSAGATSGKGSVFKIAASTGVLTTVLQFSTLTGANATVSNPQNGLTNDGQGNLWGIASVGGGASTWTVYKIKMSDGSFTKVAEHAPGGVSYLGRTPLAGLSGNATSPWLWGTTSVGGTNNLGTLFRYDPSTGRTEVAKSFTGTTGTVLGSKPNGKVHVDADDMVWGTTEEGGTSNFGTIFKYDPATSNFTTVQSFSSGGGYRPKGALVGMSDGFIWGTTSSGSSASYGSVFKINPATNAVTVVHTFASSTPANGYQLACGLVEDSSGFIWGTTQLGGANTSGTLFKIAIATGTLTVAHSFANGSGNHAGDLVLDAAGNIYGTNPLRVFKFNPNTSVLTAIFTNEEITTPLKSVTAGTLYKTAAGDIRFLGTEGTKDLTGMSSPYNNYASYRAVIYQINTTTNAVTKIHSLMESIVGTSVPAALTPAGSLYEHTDGRFYGVTQNGGTNEDLEPAGGGMIYRVGTGPAAIAQPYSTLVSQTYSQYSSVTGNTTLRGFVNPNGNSILCEFEWGPTTSLGNTITASATPGTGLTGNLCEVVLPGLPAKTTYFFRLRANTNGGPTEPSFGPIQSIVTGTPAGPTNAEISVESPIGQSLTDNTGTLDLGSLLVGQTNKQAVAVRNISLSNSLTGVSASISGANASDFVITTPLTLSSFGPGGSDGLLITFTPSDSGARAATLTIVSNDSDEASFEIQLTGEGLIQPEIEVDTPTTANVQSQDVIHDFGSGSINAGIARTFTIRNTGNAELTSLNVTIDGINSSDFAVTAQPAASIAQGGSGTFVVTFTPSVGGTRNARLQIASDDADENPFNIDLTGTGIIAPEIEVLDDSINLTDNVSTIAFGSLNTGGLSTRVITIRNVGSSALTGISLSFFSGDSAHFQFNTLASSVAAGQQITFNLSFFPLSAGAKSTILRIASNDSNENPFDIILTGTGTSSSEIGVESPLNTPLVDGVSALEYGSVNTGTSGTKTVIIRNSGTSDLTGISVSFVGTHASEFSASALGSTTVVPNDATGFTLTFTPTANGARTATMRIFSNDGDENPFDISVTGTGHVPLGPNFDIQPQSQLVLLGQSATFSPTVTGDPVITYKWKKGTALITGANSSSYGLASTKAADTAAYAVIADNPVGAEVPSQPAYLGLVTLSQGTQVLKAGGTLSLKCTATAPVAAGVSLSYLWKRSGDPLSNGTQANLSVVTGADKAALTITKVGSENSGIYTCLVTLNTPGNDPFITHGDTVVSVVGAVPVVSAIAPMTVSVSESIDFTISASSSPTSFSLVGLPAGMKFDTKTGRLTGKPTTPSLKNAGGAYTPNKLTFKAMNPVGPSLPVDFYLTIEALNPTLVGTFNGVVNREGFSNFGMGGYVQITVANTGVVSGSATLAGQKHSVVGALDISVGNDPTAVLVIKRTPATLGDLKLTMNIVRGNDLMQGRISDSGFEFVTGNLDLGGPDRSGFLNGSMGDALFNGPRGIAMLTNGDGYLSDTGNHLIRKVANDIVSTFAGTATVAGESNGTGTAASFESPEGLAFDSLGNLYVADTGNATIRKITALGVVSTFAGTADQIGSINAIGAAARFNQPSALCFDPVGNLYVVDRGNHTIRKITPAGIVTTLAGKADTAGHKDGGGIAALFNMPGGIVYEPVTKALFVTDTGNRVIRKVTLTGAVTTHAGSPGVEGDADGLLANARFINPTGITTIGGGILIVGDKVLRQINPNGVVGTVSDYVDANGLDHPAALAFNQGDDVVLSVQDTLNGVSTHHPSGTGAEAMFNARRNPWVAASSVAQMGNYTAGIKTTALAGDPSLPQGDGYATLTVSKTGTATWAGKAADGTGFTFATVMAADRHIPLHAMLYKNTGSLQGECFINGTTLDIVSDASTAFDWNKIPQPLSSTDRAYKGGFILHSLELFGGKYTPNHLYNFFNLTVSPTSLTMDFSEAALTAFQVPFTIATPNVVGVPANPSSTTLKIDPLTGIYAGSFKTGSPAVTASFTGVITNYVAGGAKRGYGHFLLPASLSVTSPMTSGRVRLEK
jgi:uncharacterized repeat protein (TIGR03803 family)